MIDQAEYTAAAEKIFKEDAAPVDNPLFGLGTELLMEFEEAKRFRLEAEQRWLSDLRQYKGIYEPEEEARMRGSKSFLRKTRVKVESVDARLMDLLFPANKERNYDVSATPEPNVPREIKARLFMELGQATGQDPSPNELKQAIKKFVDEAAAKMATRIDDQLTEAQYRDISREVMHSGNLYGTGIQKGPLVERRTRLSYVWEGKKWKQRRQSFATPFVASVPLWRWYPDMTVTKLKDARYCWEHHRLTRADLVELASRKTYDCEAIKSYIDTNPDGMIKMEQYEQELRTMGEQAHITSAHKTGQYDVYERWGWLSGDKLQSCGVNVPADRLHEAFFGNLWMLPDGQVIKAILSPIEGVDWPYHLYYFDKDETSIFGEGIASIMRDDQQMINAAVRMLLDNAAVTAGPQFEVFVPAFPPQADITSMYPGKIWARTGGDFQYQAIRQLNFDSHMGELSEILKLFDNNADETLAIPKFTYGDNPQNGAASTMGGLSMLMGQANIALKDLVVNYDEGITKPFITDMYHWNMKFSRDDSIKGDYDVNAKGASSLVAKEVRAQTLGQFGATLQPEERAFIKWDSLVRQKAEVMDLVDLAKTKEEVEQEQSSPMAKMQQQMMQMQEQLAMATAQAKLAEINAKAAEANARAGRTEAEAMLRRVEATYSAMQSAGVAATNPTIAQAGDGILRSSGWQDQDKQPGSGAEMAQGAQAPEDQIQMMASPHEGQRAGIETAGLGQ